MDSAAKDWDSLYRTGETGWDLREITPALTALLQNGYLATLALPARPRVAVPGCGRGHDLRAFAEAGCEVTGFDVAPKACDEARALLELNHTPGDVRCRDLFGLLPEFAGSFDLVYEYTCFCAIPVHLRQAYARTIAGLLVPNGVLLALVYPMRADRAGQDGPPYLVTEPDLDAALLGSFTRVASFETVGSVERRAGAERWYVWRRASARA